MFSQIGNSGILEFLNSKILGIFQNEITKDIFS